MYSTNCSGACVAGHSGRFASTLPSFTATYLSLLNRCIAQDLGRGRKRCASFLRFQERRPITASLAQFQHFTYMTTPPELPQHHDHKQYQVPAVSGFSICGGIQDNHDSHILQLLLLSCSSPFLNRASSCLGLTRTYGSDSYPIKFESCPILLSSLYSRLGLICHQKV